MALSLVACRASTSPEPSGITVSGTLVDDFSMPLAREPVFIPGRDVVYTDDEGRFTIAGVSPPYDLYVAAAATERAALGYVGLTAEEVLVTAPHREFTNWPYWAHFRGALNGGFGPLDTFESSVFFDSPEGSSAATPDHSDSYTLSFGWSGPAATEGTLRALQWRLDPQTRLVDQYRYAEIAGITATGGASNTGVDLYLNAIPTDSIAGSVTLPDGYTVDRKTLSAGFQDSHQAFRAWSLGSIDGDDATFAFAAPRLPGARFAVTARAVAGSAASEAIVSGLYAGADDVVVVIPPAPVLGEPQEGFSAVDLSTQFSWSRVADAVYLVSFQYSGSRIIIPPPPNLYVLTKDTTLTLPNLQPMQLWFVTSTSYVWEVRAYAPIRSMEDVMSEGWFLPPADGNMAYSGPRGFWFRK